MKIVISFSVFTLIVSMISVLFTMQAHAQEQNVGEAKVLSGMSVVGNSEAPKSLFIVPWQSSRIDFETSLHSGLMDEGLRPLDKDVFMRELDFYEIRQAQ